MARSCTKANGRGGNNPAPVPSVEASERNLRGLTILKLSVARVERQRNPGPPSRISLTLNPGYNVAGGRTRSPSPQRPPRCARAGRARAPLPTPSAAAGGTPRVHDLGVGA